MRMQFAKETLVEKLRIIKADLIGRIESGDRDFVKQRELFKQYIELQTAADLITEKNRDPS